MDMRDFNTRNVRRCTAGDGFDHSIHSWSLSDWLTATAGELGEAANIIKKLNRARDDIPGNKETVSELKRRLGEEIADTFIYLDLLATRAGICLEDAVTDKFNRTSETIGYRDDYETASNDGRIVNELTNAILARSEWLNVPRCDEAHPAGMGLVEAVTTALDELRAERDALRQQLAGR